MRDPLLCSQFLFSRDGRALTVTYLQLAEVGETTLLCLDFILAVWRHRPAGDSLLRSSAQHPAEPDLSTEAALCKSHDQNPLANFQRNEFQHKKLSWLTAEALVQRWNVVHGAESKGHSIC